MGRACASSKFRHEVAVYLRAPVVRHHDPGRKFGDLADHANPNNLVDTGTCSTTQGDAAEVSNFNEADLIKMGVQPLGCVITATAGG